MKSSWYQRMNIVAHRIKNSGMSVEDFLVERLGFARGGEVAQGRFQKAMLKEFGFPAEEVGDMFVQLDIDRNNSVLTADLVTTLESYIAPGEKRSISMAHLSRFIPGYGGATPAERVQLVVDLLNSQLQEKRMRPLNVYKMADRQNKGFASAESLQAAFRKIVPNVAPEVVDVALADFSHLDEIEKQDFLLLFDDPSVRIPEGSGKKKRRTLSAKKGHGVEEDPEDDLARAEEDDGTKRRLDEKTLSYVKRLDELILDNGLGPAALFKNADANNSGEVTIEELSASLRRHLPEEELSVTDLKNMMRAFD